MTIRNLEAAILSELKVVAKNSKLRQKDIMEWQLGKELTCQEGETYYYLTLNHASVCVKVEKKEEK